MLYSLGLNRELYFVWIPKSVTFNVSNGNIVTVTLFRDVLMLHFKLLYCLRSENFL
jgi:hypothetical protein